MSSASVVVDPRMRSRRIEVLRESGRRRLRRVGILAGVLAVAGVGWAIVRSPLLDVDTVRVAGGEHTTGDAVRYAAGIPQGEPLLSLDTGAVAERVEALPWVAEAQVSREWPGAVRIELTERTPLAAAPFGGDRWAVLDGDGRVLSVNAAAPVDLAAVVGLEAPVEAGDTVPAEARRAVQLLALLTERMPGTVTGVGTDLSATLALGGTVRFGSLDDIDAKVVALQAVLADVDTSCLATLDVRVPSSPALTRNEGCP
jgi:cell division protein FtsQ